MLCICLKEAQTVKLFIDGREGTTGLRIMQRLEGRKELELLVLPEAKRKDPAARAEAINASDVTLLCLPDDAARESVSLVHNSHTRLLDTSTAYRTAPGWVYGFPELSAAQRSAIAQSRFVAVPGCHASGFIACVYPLIRAGLLEADSPLACYSLTGYSGGGRKMIAAYEAPSPAPDLASPRLYALGQTHKHLPEMRQVCGLTHAPVFSPIVAPYYSGMLVMTPLVGTQIRSAHPLADVWRCLADHYNASPVVRVLSQEAVAAQGGFIPAGAMAGWDGMALMVTGNDQRLQLAAWFDNLGKGASGAAVQCLNLMLGLPETLGLSLESEKEEKP